MLEAGVRFSVGVFIEESVMLYGTDLQEFATVHERATYFAEQMRERVLGADSAVAIRQFSADAKERLRAKMREITSECATDVTTFGQLASIAKYAQAHLELAACFGKHIGIMTEHEAFRLEALKFLSLAQAEIESLEQHEFV
jgi:hypothetical protein